MQNFDDSFDDVFAEKEPAKAKNVNKNDPIRSGLEKDELKNMLKKEQKPQEPKKEKVPDLKRIPIITSAIDWKGFVPDKAQLLRNIESAVDNQVTNIVIDLMNEYNNRKQLQYDDITRINKELKGQTGMM